MRGRHHSGGGHLLDTRIDVRLHECRYRWKGAMTVGLVEFSKLVDDGSVVTRNHSTLRSHAGQCTYTGAGTGRVSGDRGWIFHTVEAVGPRGQPTWSGYTYVINMAPDVGIPYTHQCPDGSRTYTQGESGRWELNSGPEQRMPLAGGRMAGSYTEDLVDFTSWSICREGTACPPPADPEDTGTVPTPPPPRGPDPCADAEARQATIMRSMRTASEMVAFAQRDLTCAQQRHDEAFAAGFGASGPYAQFFAALGAFAAEFQPGAGGDFFGLLFALTAMAQEPGRESIDDTALEIATTDYFQELALDRNLRAAGAEMLREYERTGDAAAAVAGFRARAAQFNAGAGMAGKGLKAFTALAAWKSLWDKMSQLCDAWSLEQAWQRALWDADNERSAAEQRWNEGDVELQTLRGSCPGLVPPSIPPFAQPPWNCPATPNGDTVAGCGIGMMSSSSRGPAAPTVLLAAFAPPPSAPAVPPAADAVSSGLMQAAAALRRAEARLDKMVPLLLLFSRDLGIKVPRPLLAEAASAAAREGEAAKADALRAVELARRVEPALRAPRPGPKS